MRIEFLGTSHGVPSATRYCTSILLESNGALYVFDAGAPVADLLTRKGYSFSALKAVFVTHLHGDHIASLPNLLDLCNWYHRDATFETFVPEERGATLLHQFTELTMNRPLREGLTISVFEEGEVYRDDNITVRAVKTEHVKGMLCYGFLIEGEGKRVYLTGDMSHTLDDFPAFLQQEPTDLIITEMAHFPAERLFEKLKTCKTKSICLNHIFPIEKADEALAMRDRLPAPVFVSCDNDSIVL